MSAQKQLSKCLSTFFEDDEYCLNCDKPLASILDLLVRHNDVICTSCRYQLKGMVKQQMIMMSEVQMNITYCYTYSEVLGDYFYRYKSTGDIRLASVFMKPYQKKIKRLLKKENSVLIRMPSWKQDDENRGFNHVEEIYSIFKIPIYNPFVKLSNEKQSKRTRAQRNQTKNLMAIHPHFDPDLLLDKHVIFVDDVMTTGNTLYRAAQLLGVGNVDVVVVALHEYLSKKDDEK